MFEDHDDVDVHDDRGEEKATRSARSVTQLAPGGVENCSSQDHLEVHMLLISKQASKQSAKQAMSIFRTCFEMLSSSLV